jgi:hypothetical protein
LVLMHSQTGITDIKTVYLRLISGGTSSHNIIPPDCGARGGGIYVMESVLP